MSLIINKMREMGDINRKIEIQEKCTSLSKYKNRETILNFPELYLAAEKMYKVKRNTQQIQNAIIDRRLPHIRTSLHEVYINVNADISDIDLNDLELSSIYEDFIQELVAYLPSIALSSIRGLAYRISEALDNPDLDSSRLFYMFEVIEEKTLALRKIDNIKEIKINPTKRFKEVLKYPYHTPVIEIKHVEECRGDLQDFRKILDERVKELQVCLRSIISEINLIETLSSKEHKDNLKKLKDKDLMSGLESAMYSVSEFARNRVISMKEDLNNFKSLKTLNSLENYYGVYEDLTRLHDKVQYILHIGLPSAEEKLSLINSDKDASEKISRIQSIKVAFENALKIEMDKLRYVEHLIFTGSIDKNDFYYKLM